MNATTRFASIVRTPVKLSTGAEYVLVTHLPTGRKIEIYLVDPEDGIEMFQGYYDAEQDSTTGGPYAAIKPFIITHMSALENVR